MPSVFQRALAERQTDPRRRRWVYVAYDQLSPDIGALRDADPADTGLILIESPAKAARRPYHRQKLALVLANQRHFALEQAARGVAVRYVVQADGYAPALAAAAADLGPIEVMRPAERELRRELAPLIDDGRLRERAHDGWLTTPEQFAASQSGGRFRMDAFYRHVRRATGVLMDSTGAPEGGRFSFDTENRRPWPGEPAPPTPPRFEPDAVTREVADVVTTRFASHPGAVDLASLPATAADADRLWQWARARCLPHFGPFEDAMTVHSSGLFHTRVSPLINLHRLLPSRVVAETAALPLPLESREGFIRQVLGWREFVRHVHDTTDGFARLPLTPGPDAARPLPPAYWGTPSGLHCLDTVVADVWREGWSHHITRLMVLSNLATLLDVSPREVSDWFWVAYIDAFDWVVEPNVLGMGTFALGDVMTTKPYVSGAAYIDRMSDYCEGCALDPKRSCPITPLYWAYLTRHRERLSRLPRMALPLKAAARRTAAQREADAATFERVSKTLTAGARITS